jgi:hypothetical protein
MAETAVDGGRQNRRKTSPETEKGTVVWGQVERPGVDSMQHEDEEIMEVLLVALAW